MICLKAVILAAGEGRRCRPLTQTKSKVMLPVGNKPILEHVILALAQNNVKELYIVVGYQKERIMDYFEDGIKFGVEINYIEQTEILGTAHALSKVESHIDDKFLVVNGDNLLDVSAVHDLVTAEGDYVILAVQRRNTGDYGVITIKQDRVRAIVEKPKGYCAGIINTGAYKFGIGIFEELPKTPISERGSYELTQTLSQMVEDCRDIRAVITKGGWSDAIFAWDLLNANSLALKEMDSRVLGAVEEGARLFGFVDIKEGSIIRSGSYLMGPISIGKDCDIGPNVTILPSTSIGDSVRLGSSSEIRNSVIMNGTRIGSGTIISDSVIGESSVLGDQLVIGSGPSVIEIEGDFQRTEFGAIFADNSIVGIRSLIHPGTILETNVKIGLGSIVRGWIERDSMVI
ncbi:MAG: sugar phosphate nucleotidyltransferase [Methanotrichaceae archaeon]|nr:sugar phosphate nucleotidyltransferase [Methanotrichaceae archaeon]